MSKAILEMEMPEECARCRFRQHYRDIRSYNAFCSETGELIKSIHYGQRAPFCPLRPVEQVASKLESATGEHDPGIQAREGGNARKLDRRCATCKSLYIKDFATGVCDHPLNDKYIVQPKDSCECWEERTC